MPQTHDTTNARRDAACKAFWSSHPLNLEFRKVKEEFSLREFITFVEQLPVDEFNACMFSAGVKL